MDLGPGDLLIARAWPWTQEPLQRHIAIGEAEDPSRPPCLSVFGMVRRDGESDEELMARIVSQMKLVPLNVKKVIFVPAEDLTTRGFAVTLSEPPPCHYDVYPGASDPASFAHDLADVFAHGHERRF